MNNNHYVVIMAGGIGSRFWPKSRTALPKQFLDILGTGQTLIQNTFNRYKKIVPIENIYVVTSNDYIDIVKKQLPDIPVANIVGEPYRKNTAPCITYIAFKINELNPDAIMLAAPADNLILEEDMFAETVNKGLDFVAHINALVTIGIRPSSPNTGYGYIQYEDVEAAPGINKVKTFTEKPNLELAKMFVASGDFLWNAGIFIWKVKNFLSASEKLMPETYELFYADKNKLNTAQEAATIQKIYSLCVNTSVDFAIMEKSKNVYVLPASFYWSDLGTWNSAADNMEKDYFENTVVGDNVLVFDTHKTMIHVPNDKLVVLQGLDEYIVVDTNDILLICKKEKEQDIKEYVAEVKRNSKNEKFL